MWMRAREMAMWSVPCKESGYMRILDPSSSCSVMAMKRNWKSFCWNGKKNEVHDYRKGYKWKTAHTHTKNTFTLLIQIITDQNFVTLEPFFFGYCCCIRKQFRCDFPLNDATIHKKPTNGRPRKYLSPFNQFLQSIIPWFIVVFIIVVWSTANRLVAKQQK